MGRQGSVGGPPPQGPVPVLAGLMDGNGCSIGTHILSYKPILCNLGKREQFARIMSNVERYKNLYFCDCA